jgi:hypothetical protein
VEELEGSLSNEFVLQNPAGGGARHVILATAACPISRLRGYLLR